MKENSVICEKCLITLRSNHTHLPDKEGDVDLSLESHPSVPAVGTVVREEHRPFKGNVKM